MSALARLRLVRAVLVAGVALRALAWGTAAGLSLLIGTAMIDARLPLDLATRHVLLALAIGIQVVVAATLLWRDRATAALGRVALWVEEHDPSLAYTLVTAIETHDERLLAAARPGPWAGTAVRRVSRAAAVPIVMIAAAVIALLALPPGAVARARSPRPGDALDAVNRRGAKRSRLSPMIARVQPPAYSRLPERTIDEPAEVRALAGSKVVLRGRGDASGIVGVYGADTLGAVGTGSEWVLTVQMTGKPQALRLGDGSVQRILALEPIADEAPAVTLVSPARDSVLRAPRGRIPLAADVHDDLGIATAAFEYIVSSGEGENFTFKSGTLGAARPGGTTATISATLSLDALGLRPGDIVHVRAVARDGNDVTGPGIGSSDTRAIRIARAGEYDTVAVEAAAPGDEDKSLISERMLITLAQALEKRRPGLTRDTLVAESRGIAADQKRLRRSVGDIVFMRLGGQPSGEETTDEAAPARARGMQDLLARADSATNRSTDPIDFGGGESPVVAVNKPLLEAYNAMWDASTQLELGEPGRALPHMQRALDAIQRARQAERVYLRGRPPQVVIDVAKARLQGRDKGASSVRAPVAADSAQSIRISRFVRAVELASRDPRPAIDSLLVLRIDALTDAPAFAAALRDATEALRRGRSSDATVALARARRALAGPSMARDSIARWGLVP